MILLPGFIKQAKEFNAVVFPAAVPPKTIIDALFISGSPDPIPCLAEADVNQSGGAEPGFGDVTIGDISELIDYLFITGPSLGLPDCL